jgi:Mrp family chromosome partitioning ATPase
MTATDQAFIRAYSEPRAPLRKPARGPKYFDPLGHSVHIATAGFGPIDSDCSDFDAYHDPSPDMATQSDSSRPATAGRTFQSDPSRRWRLDTAEEPNSHPVAIAGSLADVIHGLKTSDVPSPKILPGQDIASIGHEWPVAGKKQPLSSFTMPVNGVAVPDQSEPGGSVRAFCWPAICHRLRNRFAIEFDHAVDIILQVVEQGCSLVAVAGSRPRVGTSTNVLCLAQCLAQRGRSVALVDADFANPSLDTLLQQSPQATWQNALTGKLPVSEAMVQSTSEGIALLPSARGFTTFDRTVGLQAAVTAGVVRFGYDVALFDFGSLFEPQPESPRGQISGWAELLIPAMRLDAALIVVDPAQEWHEEAQTAAAFLQSSNCRLLGVIENAMT